MKAIAKTIDGKSCKVKIRKSYFYGAVRGPFGDIGIIIPKKMAEKIASELKCEMDSLSGFLYEEGRKSVGINVWDGN